MSFSQHFSEAILPADAPPASRLLATAAATSWLRHLPDADANVQAVAAALDLAPEVVRERLQASLHAYVADHWSDLEAIGASNLSPPEVSGADPCAKAARFPMAVHRVQEEIASENFRVQGLFRSLVHTARQLHGGAQSGRSSDPPSPAATQDAWERGWRWAWACFPPIRRCMPRLAPPLQLAPAPPGRPRIIMLTGGMGAGKPTASADPYPYPDSNPDPNADPHHEPNHYPYPDYWP